MVEAAEVQPGWWWLASPLQVFPLKTRVQNHWCFPHLPETALAAPGQGSKKRINKVEQILLTSSSLSPISSLSWKRTGTSCNGKKVHIKTMKTFLNYPKNRLCSCPLPFLLIQASALTFTLKPSDRPTHVWGPVWALWPAVVTPPHTKLRGKGVAASVLQSGLDNQQNYIYMSTLMGLIISLLLAGLLGWRSDPKLPRWQSASYLWSPTEQASLFNDNEPGWG